MAYASITKPSLHMNTKLYTGDGGTNNAQTGVGFQPDWIWFKRRSGSGNHFAADVVRGTYAGGYKLIVPNDTDAEANYTYIKSLDSDGFTLGSNNNNVNGNGETYVAWNWKAGGSGSSNTDGQVNSTVSANTTAGFSIVTYTGNLSSSTSATVGHGLGVAPKMIITKRLSNTSEWGVLHEGLSSWNYVCWLNTSSAQIDKSGNGSMSAPTSTVFSTNYTNALNVNSSTYVAYCFAEKKGYSKFGSYTGNGNADGTFVYTGFKPAWVLTKEISNTSSWDMHDNKRDPDNVCNKYLLAEDAGAEGTTDILDFCSNGFKFRSSNGDRNESGATYIYAAFAEEPLVANVGTNGIPATAR